MEEGRSPLKILAVKPAENRFLGRLRSWWEGNVGIDFRDMTVKGIGLLNLLRLEIIEEPLWMRDWTSGIHKALAAVKTSFHLSLSSALLLQPLISRILRSSSTPCNHLSLGLPARLLPSGLSKVRFFTGHIYNNNKINDNDMVKF